MPLQGRVCEVERTRKLSPKCYMQLTSHSMSLCFPLSVGFCRAVRELSAGVDGTNKSSNAPHGEEAKEPAPDTAAEC